MSPFRMLLSLLFGLLSECPWLHVRNTSIGTNRRMESRFWAVACLLWLTCCLVLPSIRGRSLVVDHANKRFLRDGKPFQFVAGAMHYFRIPRAYWKDRLRKARMAGLNAVDFYVEWSSHEPEPLEYNFEGMYDIVAFLNEVKNEDLLAVLRPGPYICAERDNGGFPYWLLRKHPKMMYRSLDVNYINLTDRWYNKLLPMLVPHLYKNGGPIFAVQVENEFGHYKHCDVNYMDHVLSALERHFGHDVIYFRNDFPDEYYYTCDKVRDILVAGNFDYTQDPKKMFAVMDWAQVRPCPWFVAEYYTGWMDHWTFDRSNKSSLELVDKFKNLLKMGASVTIYMFHGGTSFGFKSSISMDTPVVTSYDYGAPVAEDGSLRPMYYKFREVIKEFLPLPNGEPPGPSKKLNFGAVKLNHYMGMNDVLNHFSQKNWLNRKQSKFPLTFEEVGQDYGFVLYTANVNVNVQGKGRLRLHGLRDRAHVFVQNSKHIFYSFQPVSGGPKTEGDIPVNKGDKLVILVENMGRDQVGNRNHDRKGLKNVTLNDNHVTDWTMEVVPLTRNQDVTELLRIVRKEGDGKLPGFFAGSFTLSDKQEPLDTFLDPTGWGRGVAYVNGINLGRYWPMAGPQVRLYLPAPFLMKHPQENRLMLFEVDRVPNNRSVKLADQPLLDAEGNLPTP
ncbi:beta-galactosidase-1-like protein [Dermacentor andersoni]|uniref:beta-galactosidase-1-like protein n=1 Tax=Dermacentor andersoni TaxID=34620 RepID=UPI002417C4A7|nr:beta-galactosidase-1-like protein [Dermacentor andersoni]